jgi:hypothetical protein
MASACRSRAQRKMVLHSTSGGGSHACGILLMPSISGIFHTIFDTMFTMKISNLRDIQER